MSGIIVFSSNSWLPDLGDGIKLHGLKPFREGLIKTNDVLRLKYDGETVYARVVKIHLSVTELFNIKTCTSFYIKNSQLLTYNIENLSKKMSSKGIREVVSYKVDYDTTREDLQKVLDLADETIRQINGEAKGNNDIIQHQC